MKKLFIAVVLILATSSVFAQEVTEKKPSNANFVTNGFWDNWEITVGGGLNYTAWDGLGFSNQEAIGDRGYLLEGGLTKCFTPVVGARVMLIGGKLNTSDDNGVTGGWIMPHADAVLNVSNWFGGYREDRVYYAKLFAGFGASFVNVTNDGGAGFAFDAGLINTFRVSKALDINLEFKGILNAGKDMPRVISSLAGKYGQIYTATVGITYRFNKRDFNRPEKPIEPDYSAYNKRIANLEKELADAQATADDLAEQLKNAKAPIIYEGTEVPVEMVVFFDWSSAKLTAKTNIQLEYVAKMMKASEKSYEILGYASKEGNAQYNMTLSQKRADDVKAALVELGVSADKLTAVGKGVSEQFKGLPQNRAVVIVEK